MKNSSLEFSSVENELLMYLLELKVMNDLMKSIFFCSCCFKCIGQFLSFMKKIQTCIEMSKKLGDLEVFTQSGYSDNQKFKSI